MNIFREKHYKKLFHEERVFLYKINFSSLTKNIEEAGGTIVSSILDATIIIYDEEIPKIENLLSVGKKRNTKMINIRDQNYGFKLSNSNLNSESKSNSASESNSADELSLEDSEEDKITEAEANHNRSTCRSIKSNYPKFYDNIYVPFNFFRNGGWNVKKVLLENPDAFFYNEEYITNLDKPRFDEVFNKYVETICEMFNESKMFNKSLLKWTSFERKTLLKRAINTPEYMCINPVYIGKELHKLNSKYGKENTSKIKNNLCKILDKVVDKLKEEKRKFRKIFLGLLNSYYVEYPINDIVDLIQNPDEKKKYINIDDKKDTQINHIYSKGFINGVIMAILDFAERLIEINVYAVHKIVNDIVNFYISLDSIVMDIDSDTDDDERDMRDLVIM